MTKVSKKLPFFLEGELFLLFMEKLFIVLRIYNPLCMLEEKSRKCIMHIIENKSFLFFIP
ncbi:hypothetical protein CXU22_02290 [Akkermansia muciniphila]|uniref:Uncharacterized protein n=1 Tax=Akkermansia muciniphila TaxID=239935 RepID=A0A2N8HGJ5_9BACT|nr:hypothetical protein CXU22_02290 [Akkermansia muciniphila]